MSKKDLKVTLIGEDKTGSAFGSASKNADGFGSKLKGAGKFAAVAFGGAVVAGVAGFGAALVNGAKDAANMQRILAQTSAVVKSTGGAAGVTTEQIDAFSTSLEKATGIEAEAIVEGQNMLLTFTNIKNGVGEGNQVFDEASTVLADMSVAMGKDMGSSAVLLGKALNDPIAGVGALSKAGVQLTDSQKATIKSMVESGDVMGAQKIILGELTTQFGGSAAAFGDTLPGQIAKAKNAFGEMFETLAVGVLPTVSTIVVAFTGAIPGALATAQGAFSTLAGWWAVNGPTITAAATTMAAGVVASFQTISGIVMGVVGFFRQHNTAATALGVVVAAVMAGVAAAWAAQAAVATVNAAKSVVAWLTTATASTTSATIQSKSTAQIVVGWIAAAAGATVNAAKVVAGWVVTGASAVAAGAVHAAQVARHVAGWVLLGAQSLLQAAKVAAAWLIAMGPIGLVIAAVVGVVALIIANWDTIRRVTVQLWESVKGATSSAWAAITGAVSAAGAAVVGALSSAWASAKSAVAGGVAAVVSIVTFLPRQIVGAIGNLGGLLVNAGRELMSGLARGIQDRISAVIDKVRSAAQQIKNLLPGSPVKDGPLTAWNNGGAGKRLMALLAGGIESGAPMVDRAMQRAVDFGDLAGMKAGGTGYVMNRLASSAASTPTDVARGGGALLAEVRQQNMLLQEQNDLLRRMPRDYQLGQRQGM